jgi:hypothetical protein
MNVSDLIAKLAKLQIEQDDIIQQLANRARDTETETKDKDKDKKPKAQKEDNEIHKGDHVLLLTGGVLCKKGDRAQVTKVTHSAVHFHVLRNNHNTYKKHKNVQKIQQA